MDCSTSCGILKVNVQTKAYKLYSNFGHTVFEKGGPLVVTVDGQGAVWVGCIDQEFAGMTKRKMILYKYWKKPGYSGKGVYAMLSCKESLFVALHEGEITEV